MITAFIICSRIKSSRIKEKPFQFINGRPIIHHLINQLAKANLPIYIAVPVDDLTFYSPLASLYQNVHLFVGDEKDPLNRMWACAEHNKIDTIIRVTHDKIFVDIDEIPDALTLIRRGHDYVYAKDFIPGTNFEVFTREALTRAHEKYSNVEYISYAIRAVAKSQAAITKNNLIPGARLLIDYQEDIDLMEIIVSSVGNEATLPSVIDFVLAHPWVKSINKTPTVTVYTCVYNGVGFVRSAMESVLRQAGIDFEYIILDDHSTDGTFLEVSRARADYLEDTLITTLAPRPSDIKIYRAKKNVGLSSLSSVALSMARGKWIIRLDADDMFVDDEAIAKLVLHAEMNDFEAVYPDNYLGSPLTVQKGVSAHHVGGALFQTSAIRNFDFTDGLRGHEGYDLFIRARDRLKIGYFNKPIFLYRQHKGSMSKTNLEDRARLKTHIEKRARLN